MLEEQPLDPERHERAGFSCSVPELDQYLHRFATQQRRKGVSTVHVLDRQGRGLGKLLIGCAVERCLQARKQVAAFALIVDARNSEAKAFYGHYGFTPCVDAAMTPYLPLG